jgi:hypothetical protein
MLPRSYDKGHEEFVCLDGTILRPGKIIEHRSIEMMVPDFDVAPHHQSWVDGEMIVLDDLVDPTGNGTITTGMMPFFQWLSVQKKRHPEHVVVGRRFFPDKKTAMDRLGISEKDLKKLLTNQ